MSARAPKILVVALVGVVVAAVLLVDRLAPPPEPSPHELATAAQSSGGLWVCPVGDGREGTELSVAAVGPGTTADDPGQLELGTLGNGSVDLDEPSWVFPGTAVLTGVEGSEDTAALARWYDNPVALARHWRLSDAEDLPSGTISGGCVGRSSDRWFVPGMSTSGGHEARLRLANPYETDATVAIRLVTPEGPEEPTVLQNVTVSGGSISEIVVNEHLPERDDLAAEVEVVSGRLAVEGYQLVRAAIGDVDGTSLLAATTQASSQWTVPWVASEEGGRMSWLWLHNPSERPAGVELTLHGVDGGVAPEGLAEVTVEPGQSRRVDLRGTFPEDVVSGAVTIRSEAAPITASGVVRLEAGDPDETGMAVQLGASPDTEWVVTSALSTLERQEQLRLVNPGSEAAVADVLLWDGSSVVRADELQDVEVPPGALATLELGDHLGEVDGWAAFVEVGEGELVVGHVGQGGEQGRELVAGAAIPGAHWAPSGPALGARHAPGLTQQMGAAEDPVREPGVDQE